MTARIFRSDLNQAVRIPVELSLDADAVTIEKQGDASLILRPLPSSGWDRFFAAESLVLPPEFEPGDDPSPQERSGLADWDGIARLPDGR
jgi:virulence-associated protein VagC